MGSLLTLLIYGATGLVAASQSGVLMGGLAAGIVGLVDFTVGWAISGRLVSGRLPDSTHGLARSAGTVLLVSISAAAVGLIVGSVSGAG